MTLLLFEDGFEADLGPLEDYIWNLLMNGEYNQTVSDPRGVSILTKNYADYIKKLDKERAIREFLFLGRWTLDEDLEALEQMWWDSRKTKYATGRTD